MNTKTANLYRIYGEAYEIMSRILRNPEVTGPEMNGAVCKITAYHDVQLSIKSIYWPQYKDDEAVSVRLIGNDTRQFVVMKSLLEPFEP